MIFGSNLIKYCFYFVSFRCVRCHNFKEWDLFVDECSDSLVAYLIIDACLAHAVIVAIYIKTVSVQSNASVVQEAELGGRYLLVSKQFECS